MVDVIDRYNFYMEICCRLTREVSKHVKEAIYKDKVISTKADRTDFVTETDKDVEKRLITGLNCQFPDHKFIGEENTASGSKVELTDAPTWIIDPIDGTMNFVHGNPIVCMSLGLAIEKELVLGVIYVPMFDMMFTAIKGRGAFMNGKQIHGSKVTKLEDALMSGAASGPDSDAHSKFLKNILPKLHNMRISGSAAYDLAMLAMGATDFHFQIGIHAWDMAAGVVIIREAGGFVCDPSGGPFDVMKRRILAASTEELAAQVRNELYDVKVPADDE